MEEAGATPKKKLTTGQKWLVALGVIVALSVVGTITGTSSSTDSSGGSARTSVDNNSWDNPKMQDIVLSSFDDAGVDSSCALSTIEDEYDTPQDFVDSSPSDKVAMAQIIDASC